MDREVSTLEGVMTVLKFGGKFTKGAYQTSGGLHGVGVTVVNFLSEWAEVEVCREGHVYHQEYERGVPKGEVRRVGTTEKRGTKTTFKPDPQIFQVTKFVYATLVKRLQELAFLNRGVKITITDARNDESETFQYEEGIRQFVTWLNRASDSIHPDVLFVEGEAEGVSLEIAVQYSGEYTENVHTYVNNISTTEGGTHLSGFRTALTRCLNNYGKKQGLFKDLIPSGEDVREGLTAVISVRVPHPQFEGQTKTKLGNSEVEGIVNSIFGDYLAKYLEENPKTAKQIIRKIVLAAEARESARKARQLIRERKGALVRRRAARQAPRLLQQGRRQVRTLPGGGRLGRRKCRRWSAPRVPGDSSATGKDHQRLQKPRRQGAGQRRSPQHDFGRWHRYR